MSRRSVLSATEQASLFALPEIQDDLIRSYTFNESDLALIRQRWLSNGSPAKSRLIPAHGENTASATKSGANIFRNYEPILLSPFGLPNFRFLVQNLADLAMQTDKGLVLGALALESLRQRRVILPTLTVIERACAEAITRPNRSIYRALAQPLTALCYCNAYHHWVGSTSI